MSRKPQQSPQRTKWHVYLQARAAKREWVGEIEAVDEREAIEIGTCRHGRRWIRAWGSRVRFKWENCRLSPPLRARCGLSRHSPIAAMTIGAIFTLTIGTTTEAESVAT